MKPPWTMAMLTPHVIMSTVAPETIVCVVARSFSISARKLAVATVPSFRTSAISDVSALPHSALT